MLFRSLLVSIFFCASLFAQQKPVIILELFTSQGCSSCPSADAVLNEIKNTMDNKTIIPISYHVDYWDYIGWKDPYASKQNTAKQRFYGRKFKNSSIYTPQLVINGNNHFVGSNKTKIHQKIKQLLSKKGSENTVTINNVKKENNKITFSYNITGNTKNKNIHYLLAIDEKTTAVRNGENRNRTLINPNIVITENIEAITTTSGNYNLSIPKNINAKENLKLIVLISDSYMSMQTGTQLDL